ncbi:MAG: enoyl-CoA hydratase/isomerase family protein [Acidobacteriota bacterium]
MPAEEPIQLEKRHGLAVVTLNRPRVINVLTTAMLRQLDQFLDDIAADEHTSCLVLRGAGTRGFCAGADVKWLRQCVLEGQPERGDEFFAIEYALDLRLHRFPKPIVALIDGITMGGGLGLAIGARYRVATPTTRLAMPEVHIGFFPDVGASWFLNRLPGAWGRYLALTGESIDGATAQALGLATHYLDRLSTAEFLERLSANPDLSWLETLSRPDTAAVINDSWVATHFGQPSLEAIRASLEAASDVRSQKAAQALREASPYSLAVTWHLLCATPASIEKAFAQEAEQARQAIRHPDYVEGVRARLVDKDFHPQWQPGRA